VKIFGIGLSKTGTSSLSRALEILGFSCIHFPSSLRQIEKYDASTDTPVALNFRQLDHRFPNSRFIFTPREKVEWLSSCEQMWRRRQKLYDQDIFITGIHRALYGGKQFDRKKWSSAYDRHDILVRQYFKGRPKDLLILNIFRVKNPWIPLCRFLGVPIPDVSFPRVNDSPSIDAIILRLLKSTGHPALVARACLVPQEYVRHLASQTRMQHNQVASADKITRGWEVYLMLTNIVKEFGSRRIAALKLGVSIRELSRLQRLAPSPTHQPKERSTTSVSSKR